MTGSVSTMASRCAHPFLEDRQWLSLAPASHRQDGWPVVCEDYRQWVLEDKFREGRPAWEAAGALFVDDVFPYELMKPSSSKTTRFPT